MPERIDLSSSILGAWRTSARATDSLIASIPAAIWDAAVPGIPRRTVRRIAAHLHNARSRWLRTLGREHGLAVPPLVNLQKMSKKQLLAALRESSAGMEALLTLGLEAGGTVPPSRGYVWRNLPLDVGHVLGYFVAHEGHHRGQLVMIARQLGHRLPPKVVNGLWWWR
jgi:uncharacterized damage-inducible protein DinB